MEFLWKLSVFALLMVLDLHLATCQEEEEGPCFRFFGNGFLKFNVPNNDNDAHFRMKFTTTEPNGILMYSHGPHGDDEALYLRNGKLSYHLYNTSPTGVEGYFGGLFQGEVPVNTGVEVLVHVYRAFNVTDVVQRQTHQQTGLVYTINGRTYSHVDNRDRSDILLHSDVFIGGFESKLSDTVGNFTGQIRAIYEETNNKHFVNFVLNHGGRVSTNCLEAFVPN